MRFVLLRQDIIARVTTKFFQFVDRFQKGDSGARWWFWNPKHSEERKVWNLPYRDPITHRTSDDEQGVYNHLRNEKYLGSMFPFSVAVSQDP